MGGRGLRLFPGKSDCFLLDFGENFRRLGRIDQKPKITLCPQPPPPAEPLKECPRCHAQISKFLLVCPECGYEFLGGDGDAAARIHDRRQYPRQGEGWLEEILVP